MNFVKMQKGLANWHEKYNEDMSSLWQSTVTLSTPQTISGVKTFTSNVYFQNEQIPFWNNNNLPVEQGTWLPNLVGNTIAGTFNYSQRVGTYYRIGNTVF